MKCLSIVGFIVLCFSAIAADLAWKCEATCFSKTQKDYSRQIVSSFGINKEQAFAEIKSQCKNNKAGLFLRDYIYRGGVPVVNVERNDYDLENEGTSGSEHFCKNKNHLKTASTKVSEKKNSEG